MLRIHRIVHPPHLVRADLPRQPIHRHLYPRMPPAVNPPSPAAQPHTAESNACRPPAPQTPAPVSAHRSNFPRPYPPAHSPAPDTTIPGPSFAGPTQTSTHTSPPAHAIRPAETQTHTPHLISTEETDLGAPHLDFQMSVPPPALRPRSSSHRTVSHRPPAPPSQMYFQTPVPARPARGTATHTTRSPAETPSPRPVAPTGGRGSSGSPSKPSRCTPHPISLAHSPAPADTDNSPPDKTAALPAAQSPPQSPATATPPAPPAP